MSDQHEHHTQPNTIYQIRLEGHLSTQWAQEFDGLTMTLVESGETHLTGTIIDQAALHGLLKRIRDLGLTLIAVNRVIGAELSGMPSNQQSLNCKGATFMKVIIFGATGTTGSVVVTEALAQGHEVTAFVRTPAKVTTTHEKLSIFKGDVLNLASVEEAVQGHDAVFVSLGAGLKGTVRSEGTQNIIRAMQKAQVRRLIVQSSLGVGDSRGNLNFYWKYIMFGMLLRNAYHDHVVQEAYVKQSTLDWTIVRPGALKEGERTGGNYRHGFAPSDKTTALEISLADTAEFMVKQLTDMTYLCSTPGLSY